MRGMRNLSFKGRLVKATTLCMMPPGRQVSSTEFGNIIRLCVWSFMLICLVCYHLGHFLSCCGFGNLCGLHMQSSKDPSFFLLLSLVFKALKQRFFCSVHGSTGVFSLPWLSAYYQRGFSSDIQLLRDCCTWFSTLTLDFTAV